LLPTKLNVASFPGLWSFQLHTFPTASNVKPGWALNPISSLTALAVDMFQHTQEEPWGPTDKLHLSKAVELTTCWLRDVYDV